LFLASAWCTNWFSGSAVQQFAEAYNHTLRQEGCSVEISAREAKAIAAIRPFLEERKGDVLTYTDTPEQASKLEEFAADLANDSDVTDEDRKICDAAWYVRPVWLFTEHPKHSLRRYLRARDWDMRKSYKLLSKSIEWRREATSKYKQCHFCAESVKAHAVVRPLLRFFFFFWQLTCGPWFVRKSSAFPRIYVQSSTPTLR